MLFQPFWMLWTRFENLVAMRNDATVVLHFCSCLAFICLVGVDVEGVISQNERKYLIADFWTLYQSAV